MRKINPTNFSIAKRTTSREINRQIALNLIKAHQPISRAALAKKMNLGRGVITTLSQELISEGIIFEGEVGSNPRGRKPTLLYLKTEDKFVVGIDIRKSRTYIMLTDFGGKEIELEVFNTFDSPEKLAEELIRRVKAILEKNDILGRCEGIGIVIPGIVQSKTGRIVRVPTLGWKNLDLGQEISRQTGLTVKIENAPKACALAQLWLSKNEAATSQNFVYVSVSDGVGCGIVVNGELVRGKDDLAGEFGHIPLFEGEETCSCGKNGCWEAYTSNLAAISRYRRKIPEKAERNLEIKDVINLAQNDDEIALETLRETARYLGFGLANIINSLNPEKIYLGGEITIAWNLIGETVKSAVSSRTLSEAAGATPISIAQTTEYPRLKGAAALIIAPSFAALKVA